MNAARYTAAGHRGLGKPYGERSTVGFRTSQSRCYLKASHTLLLTIRRPFCGQRGLQNESDYFFRDPLLPVYALRQDSSIIGDGQP